MSKFARKNLLTRTTFKLEVDKPSYFKLLAPMHVGQRRVARDGKPSDKEPPTLVNALNLETGEEGQIILAAVLKQEITENYSADSYVGKCFEICKQKRKEGKQYDPYFIAEIEDPNGTALDAVPPVSHKKR